ncbi:MAG TPA: hypothetical protein ENK91_07315 [Bacteroidetes bacterium]|nr:hypothetical protein [Bacteroidota bacterium]
MHNTEWHAYTQLRVSSDFDSNTTATVRRLKFWINSPKEFSQHWSYKVQVLFSSWMQERLFLQDAKIGYKSGLFSFDFGQFVPKYSLQWTQPDYLIPALERAKVINALHTDGSLGIRDLGAQVNFHTKNKVLYTHFGIFNGYGIKEYRFSNNGYMISHKTAFSIPLKKYKFQIGYSFMYRKAQDLQIKNVLPDSVFYTGSDIRYNFFMMFKSKYWDLQAEYLNADFEGKTADGYYILSTVNINKSQLILSIENYKNTYSNNKEPYYRIGYNYLVKKNDIKIFLDNYFQLINGNIDHYMLSLQLQFFIK